MTKLTHYIRRHTSISAVIDILHRRELPLLDPQNWDDRNDRHFMSLYKEIKIWKDCTAFALRNVRKLINIGEYLPMLSMKHALKFIDRRSKLF